MTRTLEPTAPTVARTTPSIAPAAAARRCRTVAACAFEYLDGELGPALAAAVAEHLTACSACRRRLDRDRALLDAVARTASVVGAASPSLRTRVRRALARAELARSSARRRA
ncbi:MAG TPA: zf-HC2 domain-containing protein [Gemmatimonadaceae bacterium]|nr:zf-HC2 domain-containing protein [Gemmatimonadaceae bacterium]